MSRQIPPRAARLDEDSLVCRQGDLIDDSLHQDRHAHHRLTGQFFIYDRIWRRQTPHPRAHTQVHSPTAAILLACPPRLLLHFFV
mmetsp:Transcript_48617/g.121728  ORF Transcript_48617/g.121728 Transcript_48617/m.121728 type:complete len:85 (+) Transcript_48617:70-324(+)